MPLQKKQQQQQQPLFNNYPFIDERMIKPDIFLYTDIIYPEETLLKLVMEQLLI